MKKTSGLLLDIVIFLLLSCPALAGAKNNILIIHSYSAELTWVQQQAQGIKNVLGASYSFHEFFMNTKKIDESRFDEQAQKAIEIYERINPILVFITDDNALHLAGPLIGHTTPVVFSGINGHIRKDFPWILNRNNITGVFERPIIKRALLSMINALGIEADRMLILMGDSATGKALFLNDLGASSFFTIHGMEANVFISGKFNKWKSAVAASKEQGYDLILPVADYRLKDAAGNYVDARAVARFISKHSPVPFFTIHLDQIGHDMAVGGMVFNGIYMGEAAANLAKVILTENARPSDLGFKILERYDIIISRSQLQRWHLKVLPEFQEQVSYID